MSFSSKDYSKLIKLNQMGNRGTSRQREGSKRKNEPPLFFSWDNTSQNKHQSKNTKPALKIGISPPLKCYEQIQKRNHVYGDFIQISSDSNQWRAIPTHRSLTRSAYTERSTRRCHVDLWNSPGHTASISQGTEITLIHTCSFSSVTYW